MATIERESLGFGELHLARGGHVAHFFETDQEGLDLLVCYIKTGLEAGQRCIHFVGTERERDRVLGALHAADVDVDAAGAEELLTIVVRTLVEALDAVVEELGVALAEAEAGNVDTFFAIADPVAFAELERACRRLRQLAAERDIQLSLTCADLDL